MRQRESHENAKEFVVMSSYVMPHTIVSQIANANPKHEHKYEMGT